MMAIDNSKVGMKGKITKDRDATQVSSQTFRKVQQGRTRHLGFVAPPPPTPLD